MNDHRQITAFYIETLLLILVFIAIILVLTQVFGAGRKQTAEARLLTSAVCLAENAAEAVSASDTPEGVLALLDENGNAEILENSKYPTVMARYDGDMTPDAKGDVLVYVTWQDSGDSLVYSDISVRSGDAETVYALSTAVYREEAGS